MANQEHLDILKQGAEVWNQWSEKHRYIFHEFDLSNADLRGATLRRVDLFDTDLRGADLSEADLSEAALHGTGLNNATLRETDLRGANLTRAILSEADLRGADLGGADLSNVDLRKADLSEADLSNAYLKGADLQEANLSEAILTRAIFSEATLRNATLKETDLSGAYLIRANLSSTNLIRADLSKATLSEADLGGADLRGAILREADLREANFTGANFTGADLTGADLSEANLRHAVLVETNLSGATLTQCSIYGISVWNVLMEGAIQNNLVITNRDEPIITVDNLEVAQFIYLLLNYKKLRDVLNSVMEKGVLLLGRFNDGGLELLQAIAAKLRDMEYLPIIFDFDRPQSRILTETVITLVGLSRFVVVDLSGRSVANELRSTVPHFKIPFAPILEETRKKEKYSMFSDFLENDWVLPLVTFTDKENLMELLPTKIIEPAEKMCEDRQIRLTQIFNR